MTPQEVTRDDVVTTALAWAEKFKVQATPRDCQVRQHPTHLIINESQGKTVLPGIVWKWDVVISAKSPPNPRPGRYLVPVEFLSDAICAMDFRPLA